MRVAWLLLGILLFCSCEKEKDRLRVNLISNDSIQYRMDLVSKELSGVAPPSYSTQSSPQMNSNFYGSYTFELFTQDDFTLYTYFAGNSNINIRVELNDEVVVDTTYPTTNGDTLTVKQITFAITYY